MKKMFKLFTAVLATVLMPALYSGTMVSASEPKEIPGSGGEFEIEEKTFFTFTPDTSGFWVFETFNNMGDPTLMLFGGDGELLVSMDDNAGDGNASIVTFLNAGEEFVLRAGHYGTPAPYTLLAEPLSLTRFTRDSIKINGTTFLSFTPEMSGVWEFRTVDRNDDCDPFLEIYNSRGELIGADDDGAGNLNSLLTVPLVGGEEYIIFAKSYSGDYGRYTIERTEVAAVELTDAETLVEEFTVFTFIPNSTGFWEFLTADRGDCDPVLRLYDGTGSLLLSADDNAGDLNARIIAFLEEGRVYLIHASFYSVADFYTLHVNELAMNVLSGIGGTVLVDADSVFMLTPDVSGVWEFHGAGDAEITVLDAGGNFLNMNQGAGDVFVMYLEGGETYIIATASADSFFLAAEPIETALLPTAGDTDVNGETYFIFIPNRSGIWEFRTSDNGTSDPFLWLYSAEGYLYASDDDGTGSFNALLQVWLTAGEKFILRAGFYGDAEDIDQGYSLSVTFTE